MCLRMPGHASGAYWQTVGSEHVFPVEVSEKCTLPGARFVCADIPEIPVSVETQVLPLCSNLF